MGRKTKKGISRIFSKNKILFATMGTLPSIKTLFSVHYFNFLKPYKMKTIISFTIFMFFLISWGFAQNQRQIQLNNTQITLTEATMIPYYKPDLDILNNVVVFTSGGQRKVRIYVKNIGSVRSNACNLKTTYRWRVDHESWTNMELHKNYGIRSLEPGQSTRIDMPIPDDDIQSNEGFGSNYVSISFLADSNREILELSEQNNTASKSAPILH